MESHKNELTASWIRKALSHASKQLKKYRLELQELEKIQEEQEAFDPPENRVITESRISLTRDTIAYWENCQENCMRSLQKFKFIV